MKAELTRPGEDQVREATIRALVRASLKTGLVALWPTATAPTGWLECAGAAVNRLQYANLFAIIGTTFGVGDGSTTFNLPDWAADAPSGAIYIIRA